MIQVLAWFVVLPLPWLLVVSWQPSRFLSAFVSVFSPRAHLCVRFAPGMGTSVILDQGHTSMTSS